jgi:hypothetical protein
LRSIPARNWRQFKTGIEGDSSKELEAIQNWNWRRFQQGIGDNSRLELEAVPTRN